MKFSPASAFLLFFCLALVVVTRSVAQDAHQIDSLLQELAHSEGTEKADLLVDISHAYLNIDRVKAMEYAQKSLKVAEKLDSAQLVGISLNAIGNVYQNAGQYQEAIETHRKALNIQEKIGDQYGMSLSYSGIGLVYDLIGEDSLGLVYQLKTLELSKVVGDRKGEAIAYNNLGILYDELGLLNKSSKSFEKALLIYQELGEERLVADEYSNLAAISIQQGDYQQALDYENRSLEVRERLGNTKGICISLKNLGDVYSRLGAYDQALKCLLRALEISRALGDLFEMAHAQSLLSFHYERTGQFKKALEAEREWSLLQDSLLGQQKRQQLTQLQVEFETERKVQEINLLNQEKQLQQAKMEQQALIRNFSIGIALITILILFLFYRQYKVSQERKQMELAQQLELKKLEGEKLQEIDQLKTSFFTNIAHEFRTPLTLLMGPAEQIMEDTREPTTRKMAKLIHRNTRQLLKLVNQLLDISRLEAGMEKIRPTKGDFIAFLKGLTMSFESLATQKKVNLNFHSEIHGLYMHFDHERLEKAFSNLLSNAFKFTPSGGHVHISLKETFSEAETEYPWVEVKVKDTGIGIPEEDLSTIFDRFYRAHAHTQGTGVGLSLAKELIELHNGRISVQSRTNEGTTFIVRLPLDQDFKEVAPAINTDEVYDSEIERTAIPEAPDLTFKSSAEAQEAPNAPEIVLIIEDNPDVQKFIAHTLQRKFKILKASNGEEGLKMATTHVPDLIISDVMMPVMDGYEACKQIKANEKTSHIPVVLLTAKAGMDSKLEGLETGADDYLAKPFNSRELLVRVKNLIETRKMLHDKYLENALENSNLNLKAGHPKENSFLKKIREVIGIHMANEAFGVEELSGAMAMSRTQLHRKLKALTNQSASHIMRTIRLQKARELLSNSELNVAEVGYRVGFGSPSYFSSCFMKQFGIAPSEIKKGVL